LESEGQKCRVNDLRDVWCLADIELSSAKTGLWLLKKFSINKSVITTKNKVILINQSAKLKGA